MTDLEQYRFLIDLDDALRPLTVPGDITAACARMLGEFLGVQRCSYAGIDDDEDGFTILGDYNRGVPSIVGHYRGSDFGAEYVRSSRAGEPFVIDDVESDARVADVREAYRAAGIAAVISAPVVKEGRFVAGLAVHQSTPRRWEDAEVALLGRVAARCWEAIERNRVTQELRANETRFRVLAESLAAIVWSTEPDGRVVRPSPTWAAYTGQDFAHCREFGWVDAVHPDDYPILEQAAASIAEGVFPEHLVYRLRRHDGEYRRFLSRGAAVRDEHGNIIEWVGNCTDVTARDETERKLRESEALFRTITDAMPQMVWATRPDGFHQYYNQQWYDYTGMPPGSTDGEHWQEIVHPDDRARAVQTWQHSLATGEPYDIEYRLRHHSGHYRWAIGRALPVYDETGAIARWMGTCTEIHDKKLNEERLLELDQRKDEFLAMLAHELRNPLAPITSAAALLSMGTLTPSRVGQISAIISRQAAHMGSLINDLMDVSRVTRGLVTLGEEAIDFKSVIAEAAEQVRPLLEERGHELETHVSSERVQVTGDRKRLIQIIANLLSNAAKYTPNGGHIVVRMEAGDEQVVLRVCDNGIGMTPALAERAFELFTQGDRTSDRSQGGLGIGLALVRSLVQLHGGTVSAASEGPGTGSEFTVTLPRLADETRHTLLADMPQMFPAKNAVRILVVDDNIDAAELLAMVFQQVGHEVHIEYDAIAALSLARKVVPQVCFLDIGLPNMDGNELARQLRALPGMAGAILVAVTGYGQPADKEAAFAAGFNYHFLKPVDTQALASLVADIALHRNRNVQVQ
jgi:PAS domain S-box-containing protein